jgi:hypothetical protein
VWLALRGDDWDVVAQRVDSMGHRCWGDSGLPLVDDTLQQRWTPVAVPDAEDGAIASWPGRHEGGPGLAGVYCQRVGDVASIKEEDDLPAPLAFAAGRVPARGRIRFFWRSPEESSWIALYDCSGSHIVCLQSERAGPYSRSAHWDGRDHRGRAVPAGVYVAVLVEAGAPLGAERVVWLPVR